MLTQHGVKIAPSTYYDARDRGPSPRIVSDERWKPIILTTWQTHRKVLGARKGSAPSLVDILTCPTDSVPVRVANLRRGCH
ncbi:hypothetical protein GCM10027071_23360 [Microbacterium marinum]